MRKLILALALASALTITAPNASAANCSVDSGSTYWNGYLNFTGWIGACSADVQQVEFSGTTGGASGWFDPAIFSAPYKFAQFVQPTSAVRPLTGEHIWGSAWVYRIYSRASWCGNAVHQVQTFFNYRIRNQQAGGNGTWGPWHAKWSPAYNINC